MFSIRARYSPAETAPESCLISEKKYPLFVANTVFQLARDLTFQECIVSLAKKMGQLIVQLALWFRCLKGYSLEGDATGCSCLEAFCLFGAPVLSAGKEVSSTMLVCWTVKVPPWGTK